MRRALPEGDSLMGPAHPPAADWQAPVIDLLVEALPPARGEGREGWEDMALTAWQFGCMALVALGVAEGRPWGAARLAVAREPERAPRWDDICCAVLAVLGQVRSLECLGSDGARYEDPRWSDPFETGASGDAGAPVPNIMAAHGCGPAQGSAMALRVLDCLGLVEDGRWSAAAEPVFWRRQPKGWAMAPQTDPRFAEALEVCVWSLPEELADEIEALVHISQADVDAAMEQHLSERAELIRRSPAQRRFLPKPSPDEMRRSELFVRKRRLDMLFFEGWRLSDGWLDGAALAEALTIFHDPLAMQMRAAVIHRLFPKSDLARATTR